MKTYTLEEFLKARMTDSWVTAISSVADTEEGAEICDENECPAEHEAELTNLALDNGYVFDENGKML